MYLLFTCFAAASIDADTVKVGIFRERLRVLLRHPPGTSYALTELPYLWRALERWLSRRRQAGAPYRALILPDPGWTLLIGYSLRLAFPLRGDRLRLAELIQQANWVGPPTIPEALQLISRQIDRFSSGFHEVFEPARRAFARGADAPELQALWSAVLEAAAVVLPVGEPARGRYQLFLQEDDLLRADLLLLASQPSAMPRTGVQFTQLEDPVGDYAFLVQATSDGSTTLTARQLLGGTLLDLLPNLKGAPVVRAIEQGVLLFRRDDPVIWELALSRPDEGIVRALVLERLCEPFLDLFAASKPRARSSKFDGWLEFGPFDMTFLGAATRESSPVLASVRCLQATRIGAQIALARGVQVDDGYLGTQGVLPLARCPGVEAVDLFAVQPTLDGLRTSVYASLVPRLEDPDTFEFSEETGDLEGRFNLVASRNRETIASREVVFHSRVLGHHYKAATETEHWIVEAAGPAVLPASEGVDCFLAAEPDAGGRHPSRGAGPLAPRADDRVGGGAEPFSVDDDPRLDRFVEALAALAANRKGLGEGEVLDLLARLVGVDDGPPAWDVIRAWVEAGYLDVLSRRRWRGRVYFARRPRLVVTRLEPRPVVVLHGLAPYRLRARARSVLRDLGATPIAAYSVSRLVGAPQSWLVESLAGAATAADLLDLGPPEFARSASRLLSPLAEVTSVTIDKLPGYERQGLWDWDEGGFRRGRPNGATVPVRIEWYTRADRPDLFVVAREQGDSWSTHSRNWALIMGYTWANKQVFEAHGETMLVREQGFGPYVPLPVARAMALLAGVTAGPTEHSGQGRRYAYWCATASERGRLLQRLQGGNGGDERRLRWVMAALADAGTRGDGVPLPPDLLRRLRELDHPLASVWLPGRRVPQRLLPHIRRAIQQAGA